MLSLTSMVLWAHPTSSASAAELRYTYISAFNLATVWCRRSPLFMFLRIYNHAIPMTPADSSDSSNCWSSDDDRIPDRWHTLHLQWHLSKLLQVHASRHYGLATRFEELLSKLHSLNSLLHYNPNSQLIDEIFTHSRKHAFQGVPTIMYVTLLVLERLNYHTQQNVVLKLKSQIYSAPSNVTYMLL